MEKGFCSPYTLLGGKPGGEIDEASEYDRLYILTIGNSGEAETVLIRYDTL